MGSCLTIVSVFPVLGESAPARAGAHLERVRSALHGGRHHHHHHRHVGQGRRRRVPRVRPLAR